MLPTTRIADLVEIVEDEAHKLAFPANRYARIEITTTAGERLISPDTEPRGDPEAHLTAVEIDESACTLCAMCAQVCPTGALESSSESDLLSLSFDAAKCTACGHCVQICPERERGAITLSPRIDMVALARGPVRVSEAKTLRCESCGGPIAPGPVLARITGLLGPEHASVSYMVSRRCIDCRGR